MKKFIITIALVCSTLTIWGQPFGKGNGPGREKVESARIALITERLDLDPATAQQFWPLYNEYVKKRRSIHQQMQQKRQSFDPENASKEEARAIIDGQLEMKEKNLELDREYTDKFLEVISPTQLVQLRKAESDFHQMLLDRLENRRERMQKHRGGGLKDDGGKFPR